MYLTLIVNHTIFLWFSRLTAHDAFFPSLDCVKHSFCVSARLEEGLTVQDQVISHLSD